ncbi:ADP-ribose pyrophosphatase [compost metagenome]
MAEAEVKRVMHHRSGHIYQDRTVTLQFDNAQTSGDVLIRDVITKAPCIIALVKNVTRNTIVLCKEFRVGSMREEYGFPAGMIDPGELPIQAAIREVFEETGYIAKRITSLGEPVYTSSGFTDEHSYLYYVEVEGDPTGQDLDQDESIEVVEVSTEDMRAMLDKGEICSAQALACLFRYQNRLWTPLF